jgi:hypothetical protein
MRTKWAVVPEMIRFDTKILLWLKQDRNDNINVNSTYGLNMMLLNEYD